MIQFSMNRFGNISPQLIYRQLDYNVSRNDCFHDIKNDFYLMLLNYIYDNRYVKYCIPYMNCDDINGPLHILSSNYRHKDDNCKIYYIRVTNTRIYIVKCLAYTIEYHLAAMHENLLHTCDNFMCDFCLMSFDIDDFGNKLKELLK